MTDDQLQITLVIVTAALGPMDVPERLAVLMTLVEREIEKANAPWMWQTIIEGAQEMYATEARLDHFATSGTVQ